MPTAFDAKIAVGSILRSTGITKVKNGVEPKAVEGFANNPYKIPNLRVDCMLKNTHVPVRFWRSVGASQNAFFVESFIDEMAHAAGRTRYKFRRTLLAASPTGSGCSTRWPRRAIGANRSGKARRGIAIMNVTAPSSARSPR